MSFIRAQDQRRELGATKAPQRVDIKPQPRQGANVRTSCSSGTYECHGDSPDNMWIEKAILNPRHRSNIIASFGLSAWARRRRYENPKVSRSRWVAHLCQDTTNVSDPINERKIGVQKARSWERRWRERKPKTIFE